MNIRLVLSPAFMKDKVHLNIKKQSPLQADKARTTVEGKTVTMCIPSCVPPPPRMSLLLCHWAQWNDEWQSCLPSCAAVLISV